MFTRRVYGDWYGIEPAAYERWYPDLMSPEEHAQRRSEVFLGTPDDLVPGFERLRDIVGEGLHVMFRSKYPGSATTPPARRSNCSEKSTDVSLDGARG